MEKLTHRSVNATPLLRMGTTLSKFLRQAGRFRKHIPQNLGPKYTSFLFISQQGY